MNILALDLGTTFGWAVGDIEKQKVDQSGSCNSKPTRFQSHGHRYLKLKHQLYNVQACYKLKHIYYEEVRKHVGTDAAHVYGGYVATLQQWCIENNIEYTGIPVGTIKKHITGKGNASKEAVINAVKEKLRIFPKDDNEADAIALCDYALSNLKTL